MQRHPWPFARSPSPSWSCWPSRSFRCDSSPTPATTRRRAPPAGPTTCSPKASGRAQRPAVHRRRPTARVARDARAQNVASAVRPPTASPPSWRRRPTRPATPPSSSPSRRRLRKTAPTESLVHHLRHDVIPPVVAGTPSHALVGGVTAAGIDVAARFSAAAAVGHRRRGPAVVPAPHGGLPVHRRCRSRRPS